MGFGGSSGGGGSLGSATDVAFSNPANNEVVLFDSVTGKWKNAVIAGGGSPTYANLPVGTTITVAKVSGAWPARPTSRNDIIVQWKGPDPSPSIVSSGTGGMLDNVDIRLVTP